MPSRFVHTISLESKTEGHGLQLRFDDPAGAADKGLAMVNALNEAKEFLDIAIIVLERNERKQLIEFALTTFFRIPPKFHEVIRTKIAGKLKIIRGGLSQDGVIKIGALTHRQTGKPVAGYVTISEKKATKYYHTSVGEGEDAVRYGAIHIANNSITSNALIHEASHKFVQTEDYFYLQPGGSVKEWKLEPAEKYDEKDDVMGYANADSCAWLAWFIGVILLRKNN
jgi:hypothetical protein